MRAVGVAEGAAGGGRPRGGGRRVRAAAAGPRLRNAAGGAVDVLAQAAVDDAHRFVKRHVTRVLVCPFAVEGIRVRARIRGPVALVIRDFEAPPVVTRPEVELAADDGAESLHGRVAVDL